MMHTNNQLRYRGYFTMKFILLIEGLKTTLNSSNITIINFNTIYNIKITLYQMIK